MSGQPAVQLGIKSQGCPEVECNDVCAVCEHKQWVYDNSDSLNGNPEVFLGVSESMLNVHEELMRRLCDYVPEICKRGEIANFPCIQCGLIDVSCIEFGEVVYAPQSCTDCICFTPLDFSNCDQQNVDLSQAPFTEIYEQIISALEQLSSGFANGCTAEEFLKLFLPDATLLFFKDNGYHFSIGSADPVVLSILPLLAALAPIPLGARLTYYVACDDQLVSVAS